MSRRPIFIVLLLSMLLHAVSLGGHWAGVGNVEKAVHALLHWAGGAHHHHEHQVAVQPPAGDQDGFEAFTEELAAATLAPDESYHRDHSADSNHHLSVDGYLTAIGPLPTSINGAFDQARSSRPACSAETAPAAPFIEGLRRPPRSLS